MAGANDKLMDKVIAHEIDLNRVTAGMRAKILRNLKALEQDLITKIVAVDPTGVTAVSYQQKRLLAMVAQARASVTETYSKISGAHGGDLYNLARLETQFTKGAIDGVIGIPLNTVALTQAQLSEVVGNTIIQGAKSKEWWAGQSKGLTDKFTKKMRMGILQGEGVAKLARRVRGTRVNGFKDGIMNASRAQAENLVRTSVQAVMNEAREATYAENADIVKGLTWISTLDGRVTDICIVRGGKPYTLDKKPIGHDTPWLEGPGRIHWGCRSSSTGILKSWDELAGPNAIKTGGKPSNIDAMFEKQLKAKGMTPEQIAGVKRNARASMDGQVPKDLTMSKWLGGKGEAFQNNLLGAGRAQLWRDGKIGLAHLVDDQARSVPLKVLLEKYGIKPVVPPTSAAPAAVPVKKFGKPPKAPELHTPKPVQQKRLDNWEQQFTDNIPATEIITTQGEAHLLSSYLDELKIPKETRVRLETLLDDWIQADAAAGQAAAAAGLKFPTPFEQSRLDHFLTRLDDGVAAIDIVGSDAEASFLAGYLEDLQLPEDVKKRLSDLLADHNKARAALNLEVAALEKAKAEAEIATAAEKFEAKQAAKKLAKAKGIKPGQLKPAVGPQRREMSNWLSAMDRGLAAEQILDSGTARLLEDYLRTLEIPPGTRRRLEILLRRYNKARGNFIPPTFEQLPPGSSKLRPMQPVTNARHKTVSEAKAHQVELRRWLQEKDGVFLDSRNTKAMIAEELAERLEGVKAFEDYIEAQLKKGSLNTFYDSAEDTQWIQQHWKEVRETLGITGTIPPGRMDEFLEIFVERVLNDPVALDQARRSLVADLISRWSGTSGDRSEKAIAMQLAAQEEFGLAFAETGHWPSVLDKGIKSVFDSDGEAYKAFLRAQYESTQEFLFASGRDTVRVYRGVTFGAETPLADIEAFGAEVVERHLGLQPISSFSVEWDTALDFAEGLSGTEGLEFAGMMVADVPVERILSTSRTGFGCLAETEIVVLGGAEEAELVSFMGFHRRYKYYAPDDWGGNPRKYYWSDRVLADLATEEPLNMHQYPRRPIDVFGSGDGPGTFNDYVVVVGEKKAQDDITYKEAIDFWVSRLK